MASLGAQSFAEMRKVTPEEKDPRINAYVRCVVDPLLAEVRGKTSVSRWEVVVFRDESANAFALPGGKIGIHTGLLKVAKTDGQLAAVVGHEIGHVMARHGAERVSQQLAASGIQLGVSTALSDSKSRGLILAGLALGAQFGVLLPYSRAHESEADLIGLTLMAQAGFDPRQSVELWKNMGAANSGGPPEFLSTHPSGPTRIESLRSHLGPALEEQARARAQGKTPVCAVPN
jgi:predicted Zn-dependent protease